MDKFSKLYAEEKKLDIEDYVTYESTYMKFNYRQNPGLPSWCSG